MARANFERAKAMYPSIGMDMDDWLKFFDTPAGVDAMGRLLYDIYDEVKAQEEREAGVHKMGRRPARRAVSIDELFSVVMPQQYSNDTFTVLLRRLIGERSQRAFASKIPCSQPYLARLLSGEYQPDLTMLERIAEAGKVKPWYFPEWRAMFMGQLITDVLLAKPNLSIDAVRNARQVRSVMEKRS